MNATRDNIFLLLIFLGIAMAEPTTDKQFEQGLNEAERAAFYEIFGNDNQEGVSDERTSQNEQ